MVRAGGHAEEYIRDVFSQDRFERALERGMSRNRNYSADSQLLNSDDDDYLMDGQVPYVGFPDSELWPYDTDDFLNQKSPFDMSRGSFAGHPPPSTKHTRNAKTNRFFGRRKKFRGARPGGGSAGLTSSDERKHALLEIAETSGGGRRGAKVFSRSKSEHCLRKCTTKQQKEGSLRSTQDKNWSVG
ncbi:unnamed protein product [Amoebophrya sp. A25]|nr:unnamed protein product [Amoebophrya sp. A25]|eukprot:GSA25T00017626001.1